jgi:hypothetical protein
MKSLSPWDTNAAVCAQAFIKPAEIRQSSRRTDPGREHSQYVFLAKPLQSSSFSENKKYMTQSTDKLSASHSEEHMLGHGFYNKYSHEQAKANTCGLPLVEYRSPSPFIRREMFAARSSLSWIEQWISKLMKTFCARFQDLGSCRER